MVARLVAVAFLAFVAVNDLIPRDWRGLLLTLILLVGGWIGHWAEASEEVK